MLILYNVVVDNEQGALLKWYWERKGNTQSKTWPSINLSITHATKTGLGSSSESHGDKLALNCVTAHESHHVCLSTFYSLKVTTIHFMWNYAPKSSGTLYNVLVWAVSSFWNDSSTFIFRVKQFSKSFFLDTWTLQVLIRQNVWPTCTLPQHHIPPALVENL